MDAVITVLAELGISPVSTVLEEKPSPA